MIHRLTTILLALSAATQWAAAALVSVESKQIPEVLREGGGSVLQLVIKNTGAQPLANARVTHRLPTELTLVGADSSQGRCTEEGNQVVCRLGALAAGASATLSVTGKVSVAVPPDKEFIETKAVTAVFDGLDPLIALDQVIIIAVPRDFGDAPDNPYPTLLASNGARHRVGALFLGNQIDAEADGLPNAPATGDDINQMPDDEDGVRFVDPLIPGDTVRINVRSSGVGKLSGWIDFNQNGVWEAGEQVLNCVPVGAGNQQFTTVIPSTAMIGWTYSRFRLGSNCVNSVTGYVASGEVEDYRLRIRPDHMGDDLRIVDVQGRPHLGWDQPEGVVEAASELNGEFRKLRGLSNPAPIDLKDSMKFFRMSESPAALDFVRMLMGADLVFEGTVTDIKYRQSRVESPEHVALPHTFVTFDIHHVLKGDYAKDTICLRFAGGPAPDGRVLKVSHVTLFDVGERSILFVRRNGHAFCPLVGGAEGRFRIHEGKVYDETGHPLLWTSEAQFALGSSEELEEVQQNRIGERLFEQHKVLDRDPKEIMQTVLPDELPIPAEQFRDFLKRMLAHLKVTRVGAQVAQVISCDSEVPFIVRHPKEVAPRPVKQQPTPGAVTP